MPGRTHALGVHLVALPTSITSHVLQPSNQRLHPAGGMAFAETSSGCLRYLCVNSSVRPVANSASDTQT